MKPQRKRGIVRQKEACFILHRLRKAKEADTGWFSGTVKVSESDLDGERATI